MSQAQDNKKLCAGESDSYYNFLTYDNKQSDKTTSMTDKSPISPDQGQNMPRTLTRTLECPKSMVGRVIGKNGETIKALQIYTGALIQIDQAIDPMKVNVSANNSDSLTLAVSMVNDIVNGNFKGFALLRQIANTQQQPAVGGLENVAPPQPIYAPGYGFIPASQMYGDRAAPTVVGQDRLASLLPLSQVDNMNQNMSQSHLQQLLSILRMSQLQQPNARPMADPMQQAQTLGVNNMALSGGLLAGVQQNGINPQLVQPVFNPASQLGGYQNPVPVGNQPNGVPQDSQFNLLNSMQGLSLGGTSQPLSARPDLLGIANGFNNPSSDLLGELGAASQAPMTQPNGINASPNALSGAPPNGMNTPPNGLTASPNGFSGNTNGISASDISGAIPSDGWVRVSDPDGNQFYWNQQTGQRSWNSPLVIRTSTSPAQVPQPEDNGSIQAF